MFYDTSSPGLIQCNVTNLRHKTSSSTTRRSRPTFPSFVLSPRCSATPTRTITDRLNLLSGMSISCPEELRARRQLSLASYRETVSTELAPNIKRVDCLPPSIRSATVTNTVPEKSNILRAIKSEVRGIVGNFSNYADGMLRLHPVLYEPRC